MPSLTDRHAKQTSGAARYCLLGLAKNGTSYFGLTLHFVACCLELISDDCSCAELHTGDSGVNWRLNPGVEIPVNPSQRGACHPQSVLEAKCVSNHSTARRR